MFFPGRISSPVYQGVKTVLGSEKGGISCKRVILSVCFDEIREKYTGCDKYRDELSCNVKYEERKEM